MKRIALLIFSFFLTITITAQQSINYKALVKDNLGNVLANQNITVQFSILEDATIVYTETHTPTTNANGLIILNIGEGTTPDDFSEIHWDSDAHFLNVQMDTGAGLVDLGTTQFMTVPYALSAGNVSGLEAIDEGNGVGWRIKGKDPDHYGNIGENATDLSHSNVNSTTHGATGEYTTAIGFKTTALGNRSTAMGYETIASGIYSTAMGRETTASGSHSTTIGYNTTASDYYSTAMGINTEASGYASTSIGDETTASGYASTALGDETTASGGRSTALGYLTTASGSYSVATGYETKAESRNNTTLGRYNIGGGNLSTWIETDPLFEIGNGANDANRSNALTVLKNGKVGIGNHQPNGYLEIKANNNTNEPTLKLVHEGTTGARINFTNTTVTNGNRWTLYGEPNDVDANSTFNIYHPNTGNIIRVRGDGNVGIGTVPSYRLDVRQENTGGYVAQVYNTSTNQNADGLKIRLGTTNAPTSGNNFIAFFDGNAGNGIVRGLIQGNGSGVTYNTTSDRRLKTNIKDINNALVLINKIQPRTYEFKSNLGINEYGFIAQELQPLYAQAVTGTPDSDVEKEPMMVDYGRLTPLLTAGIKELNDKLTSQEKNIKLLNEENKNLKAQLSKYESLEARLTALENKAETSHVNKINH
ncbi:tail fiber domain-containing protein [Lacinutrix iliipiscaria]|uniref:Tail fiber domain-containing protein n=1 Tax=Lacinutrix iliipiscaria TaxID=1230532 RepID=A0ABW5WHV2_9FLAO